MGDLHDTSLTAARKCAAKTTTDARTAAHPATTLLLLVADPTKEVAFAPDVLYGRGLWDTCTTLLF